MNPIMILYLLGLILAVVALFVPHPKLLPGSVILIAIGLLFVGL